MSEKHKVFLRKRADFLKLICYLDNGKQKTDGGRLPERIKAPCRLERCDHYEEKR